MGVSLPAKIACWVILAAMLTSIAVSFTWIAGAALDHFPAAATLMRSIVDAPGHMSLMIAIASVEATIATIAVPVSIQLISMIAERYKSEHIRGAFERDASLGWYQSTLVCGVGLSMLVAIVVRGARQHPWLKGLLAWSVVIWFGVILFYFLRYVRTLNSYTRSPEHILDRFLAEAEGEFPEPN